MIIATSRPFRLGLLQPYHPLSPHFMLYWSLLLFLLIPFVTFLQPGFIAMATLSIISEESSSGLVDNMDDEETQIVPETQFNDEHGDDLDFNDKDSDDPPATPGRDSMTPKTKKVFEESRPLSSQGSALAATDLTFQLTRPKSSGEDSFTAGFSFAKHQIPKMNFQHGKRQQSPSPETEKQRESREYREGELFVLFALSSLIIIQKNCKQSRCQPNRVTSSKKVELSQ